MCLLIKPNEKPMTAKRDMVCYKVVEKWVYADRSFNYITPFYNMVVVMGDTYYTNKGLDKTPLDDEKDAVDEGYHSIRTLREAKIYHNKFLDLPKRYILVKCIIPKGAQYYKGYCPFWGRRYNSYVSDHIKYIEEI